MVDDPDRVETSFDPCVTERLKEERRRSASSRRPSKYGERSLDRFGRGSRVVGIGIRRLGLSRDPVSFP
jgi:hypothetical protein